MEVAPRSGVAVATPPSLGAATLPSSCQQHAAELRSLLHDRALLTERLRGLGLTKMGDRLRAEQVLRTVTESHDAVLSDVAIPASDALASAAAPTPAAANAAAPTPAAAPAATLVPLRVAFWSRQLCERGTDVAMFDYADFGEQLLGFEAWVVYHAEAADNFEGCIAKYRRRFGERVVGIRSWAEGL